MLCGMLGVLGASVGISLLVAVTLMTLIVLLVALFLPLIGRLPVSLPTAVLLRVPFVVELLCPLLPCKVGCCCGLLWLVFGVSVRKLAPGITSLGLALIDLLLCPGLPCAVLLGGVGLFVANHLRSDVLFKLG